jgi:hypothetical protein
MAKRQARASKARKSVSKRAKKTTRLVRAKSKAAKPAKRAAARKATKKTKTASRPVARKARAARAKTGSKASARVVKSTRKAPKAAARKASPKKPARKISAKAPSVPRKVPALNRARRTIQENEMVPSPPSSLDLDRTASAARTGRREMKERMDELTQTGPALTGGDLDADWESAYSVGDEVPGGDNPTPDQDVVDEIGEALGLQYEDNEELKGESKITKRDSHRWELDPASSDDYNDR